MRLVDRCVAAVCRTLAVARRVIGVPDYEAYVAHVRARHPDVAPMTQAAFAHDALARRYERVGNRCC
ncbi:MAG: YbdD/YjiX family protein [Gemmatimonadaceae bacterium]|nr:YbdD/YjiX family protein [Gemmatimonadaceae bacterium]